MTDRIEKQIEIGASVSCVWQALTDHGEFSEWFQVQLESPLEVGELACGKITHPGFEHVTWQATLLTIEAERRFVGTWHPYAVDPAIDYSTEPTTLVEFTPEPTATGTLLRVVESGFGRIPLARCCEAIRMNDRGWEAQIQSVRPHVEHSDAS